MWPLEALVPGLVHQVRVAVSGFSDAGFRLLDSGFGV